MLTIARIAFEHFGASPLLGSQSEDVLLAAMLLVFCLWSPSCQTAVVNGRFCSKVDYVFLVFPV
jgi:CBS-domain-containing membrane protein